MSYERNPYADIRRVPNRSNQIDVKELLKKEVIRQGRDINTDYRFGLTGLPQPIESQQPPAAPAASAVGFEDIELYFDSTQRDQSSDYSIGEVRWSIPLINNATDIKNCVEMHLNDFYFPKIYAPSTAPEFFYFRRAYVEFQNAPSNQAVLGPANNKFHFEFSVENINGQAVRLVPTKKSFFFQRPITSIVDFQIRFMVPPTTSAAAVFKKVPIPKDTLSIATVFNAGFGYNPIRFQVQGLDDTTALAPLGAILAPGLAVFISGYISNDAAVNNAVNNTDGIYVTNILDATTFEIAGIDASTVTVASAANLYIPKNRFAFPLRFTCTRDQVTNYVDVGHD